MSYIIEIKAAAGHRVGYVHVPARAAKVRKFIVPQAHRAQRFSSSVEAHDRAGRYNALHVADGRTAHVVPYAVSEA